MKKIVLLRSKNKDATEFYYDIVKAALIRVSDDVEDVYEGEQFRARREDLVVVGSCLSFLRMWLRGYRNIITWFQGVLPEESYMRNHNLIRRNVLEIIEKFALRKSRVAIFVSNAMKNYYENYYKITFDNFYIMPCFNTYFAMQNSGDNSRYENPVFTYVGGLNAWQCINETIMLYREIEKVFKCKSSMLILTRQRNEAEEIVKKIGIKNYTIKTVHYKNISEELRNVAFGFNLRRDNVVNRVATPTKLANYVANGVIPIVSSCVEDFVTISKNNPYVIAVENMENLTCVAEKVRELLASGVTYEKVFCASKEYFTEYYNSEHHVKRIAELIARV